MLYEPLDSGNVSLFVIQGSSKLVKAAEPLTSRLPAHQASCTRGSLLLTQRQSNWKDRVCVAGRGLSTPENAENIKNSHLSALLRS